MVKKRPILYSSYEYIYDKILKIDVVYAKKIKT